MYFPWDSPPVIRKMVYIMLELASYGHVADTGTIISRADAPGVGEFPGRAWMKKREIIRCALCSGRSGLFAVSYLECMISHPERVKRLLLPQPWRTPSLSNAIRLSPQNAASLTLFSSLTGAVTGMPVSKS